jgi:hypothetical protein
MTTACLYSLVPFFFLSSALLELVLGRPGGLRPAGHGRLRLQSDQAEAPLRRTLYGTLERLLAVQ